MSTEVESAPRVHGLLGRAHRLLDVPILFEINQVVVDGGKRAPVSRFLEEVEYDSVVDLGCGTGAWSYLATGRYLGLDQSPSFIQGCKARFQKDARKRFEVGDLESMALEEDFDLALMMSVLHHLSDTQAEAALSRVAGRARLLLVMDLIPIPRNPLSRLLYGLDRGDFIRSLEDQRAVLLRSGHWQLEREDSFHSYNRLYRHSLFLLRAVSSRNEAFSQSRRSTNDSH